MGEAKRRKQEDPAWGMSFEAWGKLFQPNVKTYVTQYGLQVCDFQDLYKDMMWYHHRIKLAVERRAEGLSIFAVKNYVCHALDTRLKCFLPLEKCDRFAESGYRQWMTAAWVDLGREKDGIYIFGRHTPEFVGWVYHHEPTLNGLYSFATPHPEL
ncbi:hypothetical protein [Nostoc sp.]|uniref:hypothetical protein n=1 Tax=Nostoc sp. TaxID=1180 RepID=UPI002FF76C42